MTHRLRQSDEPTYAERRAAERLTAAADTMRRAIMQDVTDRAARTAALARLRGFAPGILDFRPE
jgi:hypothetical protein